MPVADFATSNTDLIRTPRAGSSGGSRRRTFSSSVAEAAERRSSTTARAVTSALIEPPGPPESCQTSAEPGSGHGVDSQSPRDWESTLSFDRLPSQLGVGADGCGRVGLACRDETRAPRERGDRADRSARARGPRARVDGAGPAGLADP